MGLATGELSRNGEFGANCPLIAQANPSKRMKSPHKARIEQC